MSCYKLQPLAINLVLKNWIFIVVNNNNKFHLFVYPLFPRHLWSLCSRCLHYAWFTLPVCSQYTAVSRYSEKNILGLLNASLHANSQVFCPTRIQALQSFMLNSRVTDSQHCKGRYTFHLQGSRSLEMLKMKAACSF
jgi:hypothetical protein